MGGGETVGNGGHGLPVLCDDPFKEMLFALHGVIERHNGFLLRQRRDHERRGFQHGAGDIAELGGSLGVLLEMAGAGGPVDCLVRRDAAHLRDGCVCLSVRLDGAAKE
ncbi:hypothetical protein EDC15_11926 [Acetobacter aceti NBRC 14818]|nr:hypothetical protein EDC15_11926 [Acetobacter aceti NBRC 14818]